MICNRYVALTAVALAATTRFAAAADPESPNRSRDANPPRSRTNIVLILTDNQGAWTLGCYGNRDIRTPNIDRLAAQGMRFTRALASNPVCSPTRATLLTGLIPSQHGVHSFLDNRFMMGPEAYNTLEEFRSLPEILRDDGYVCGLSGKWHLGANLTPQEGFHSWITMPVGHTREFYGSEVIEDGRVRVEPGYMTDLWTERAVRFIAQNKDRPFFLLLAYNGPYSLGRLLLNPARNRHAEYYADKELPSFPRDRMHPWQFHNKEYLNNPVSIRRVAAETSGVDDGVGEVLATLERLGLERDTLVIYTADQGWMGGQNGLWGMGDHTRPVGAFELMMQVPLIVRHPARVPAGTTSDLLVANYDVLPTLLSHLELAGRIPQQPRLPGRDFSRALHGEPLQWNNEAYYEMENTRAVRTDHWKYVARFPNGPFELYDMQTDPQERFNLFGQPGAANAQTDLAARLDAFFATYADPQFDLWRGGRSKASRVSK